MLGENAVRFRVAPISSAIAWKRLLKISSCTGFVFMGYSEFVSNTKFKYASIVHVLSGGTSVVELYSPMIAGPLMT